MVVLHIAHLDDSPFAGVNVAVPQHILAQQRFATVGFVNLTNIRIEGITHQFVYESEDPFGKLPAPFCHPDIIVFHEIYRPAFLKISRMARKHGIPYVVFPHGSLTRAAQRNKALKKIVGNLLLFNRFVQGAVAIQCLSQREMEESGTACERFLGTNGIETLAEKTSFSEKGFEMIFIGRLDIRIKGLDLLLDALDGCRNEMVSRSCRVHLYGPDENGSRQWLEDRIRQLGLQEVVLLHPAVQGTEKLQALCAADCYIQTSRSEGMSMGILEAQAIGLPCIVTEGTGMTGFVQQYNSGWVCQTSAPGIRSAILQALDDKKLLVEKSAGARNMIRENFEWDSIARQTIQTYRRLAGE